MDGERSSLRVMIFVDYSNLSGGEDRYRRQVDRQFRLDLIKLIERLAGGRQYAEAHLYRSSRRDPTPAELTEFQRLLATYRIYIHPFKRRRGKEKRVDVRMALDIVAVAKADRYDVAVIVSGDEDFIPAAEDVQKMGKEVEVASFISQLSRSWIGIANEVWQLDVLAPQIARSE